MRIIAYLALAVVLTLPTAALALGRSHRAAQLPREPIVEIQTNITGNGRGVIISRGSTGADTIFTNSAAGGNAGQPERAIPLGSAGGGDSGGSP